MTKHSSPPYARPEPALLSAPALSRPGLMPGPLAGEPDTAAPFVPSRALSAGLPALPPAAAVEVPDLLEPLASGALPLDTSWLERLDDDVDVATESVGDEAFLIPRPMADEVAPAEPEERAEAGAGGGAGEEAAGLPPWMAWVDDALDSEAAAAVAGGTSGSDPVEASDPEPATPIEALLMEPEDEEPADAPEPWAEADDLQQTAFAEAQEPAAEQTPAEDSSTADVPDTSIAAAQAAFSSTMVHGTPLPDGFAGVFHEVADRLENIAGSLRRRSSGEALTTSRGTDPLELLLTGFVLGYIARQGNDTQNPDPQG